LPLAIVLKARAVPIKRFFSATALIDQAKKI
jgi:hypothetical protein